MAGFIGNVVEWYDFAVYGYLAGVIAPVFSRRAIQRPPLSGLTGSWANIGSMTGSLLGVAAAALVTNTFDTQTLDDWAWRLPFLGGAILGITAISIRRNLHNSERFSQHHENREETSPLLQAFTTNRYETLVALAFASSYGTCYYIAFVYLPEWLSAQQLMPRSSALLINTVMMMLTFVAWPLHAWMLDSGGSTTAVIAAHALVFLLLAVPLGSAPALFVELFPESDRLSGYSVAFNPGLGVFGGLTPMIATALIATTGLLTAPAMYLAIAAFIAVLSLMLMPDRSREPLR
ncbi:MFS transporter [Marinobacter sp. F4206]|nr:MFS transporter [Marinobacter sp. F4206]